MIIILFIGIFIILVYVIAICCGPCVYFYLRSQYNRRQGGLDEGQVGTVISRLSRTPFDPTRFAYDNKCSICLCEYEKDEELSQLKCDPRHYFHSDCIIGWIEQGNNVCPLCREPIEDIESLRAMMEGGDIESQVRQNDRIRRHKERGGCSSCNHKKLD